MKQNTLYIILALCAIIITILLTMIFTSSLQKISSQTINNDLEYSKLHNKLKLNKLQYQQYHNHHNHYNYPNRYYNSDDNSDIDYAYDYDGYWFQPSRWWNNIWNNRRHNIYNRRDTYDRRDGLDMHNRYINNSIHINNPLHQPHSTQQSTIPVNFEINNLPLTEQPINRISLVKPEPDSSFPFPTLSSSINIMPEEVAMSPMSGMHSEPSVQSISTFISDIPSSYNSNFNYKGPDKKNSSPLPIDVMASQAIGLQQHTIGNEIIKI